MRFTDRSVRALKPHQNRYEVFEDGRKGLGIRVAPSGRKSWVFVYRRKGKLSRVSLGTYPDMSLGDAHTEHGRWHEHLRKGGDPAVTKRLDKHNNITAPTVEELAELYLERHAIPKKRSWREDQRILKKDVLSRWADVKAKNIERRDVISLLDAIVDRGAPITATQTLAVIRKMYNFALERSIVEATPCMAVKAPAKAATRERVLSDEEIRSFWQGLERAHVSEAIRLSLKLILVTAQRKGEIVNAEKSEFDLDRGWWTIPGGRSKNTRAHRVPLCPLALKTIREVWALSASSQVLFPSPRGDKSVLGTSVNRALRDNREIFNIDHFTPHDLRRTAASHMTSMGIPRLVVSKILNHVESGVTAVYDRHSYDDEKRQALETWGRKLEPIIGGEIAKSR